MRLATSPALSRSGGLGRVERRPTWGHRRRQHDHRLVLQDRDCHRELCCYTGGSSAKTSLAKSARLHQGQRGRLFHFRRFVGRNDDQCSIHEVYATGSVTGVQGGVGGFVGQNYGSIVNAYATGAVTGTSAGCSDCYVGRLCRLDRQGHCASRLFNWNRDRQQLERRHHGRRVCRPLRRRHRDVRLWNYDTARFNGIGKNNSDQLQPRSLSHAVRFN